MSAGRDVTCPVDNSSVFTSHALCSLMDVIRDICCRCWRKGGAKLHQCPNMPNGCVHIVCHSNALWVFHRYQLDLLCLMKCKIKIKLKFISDLSVLIFTGSLN